MLFVFVAPEILPGDVLDVSLTDDDLAALTPEHMARMRAALKLDCPAAVRYFDWVSGALVGDFGTTIQSGALVGLNLATEGVANAHGLDAAHGMVRV